MNFITQLPTFKGGVHPADNKEKTADKVIHSFPIPEQLTVSLAQHAGAPAEPLVEKGNQVKRGEKIGEAAEGISAAVHAPAAGQVKQLRTATLPSGEPANCLLIDTETEGEEKFYPAYESLAAIKPEEIVERVKEAGIVGLGGAAFPTHVKLSPPEDKPIDTVILNGCECEPYLTADHRNMIESPETVVTGLKLIMKAVGAERGIIGVEENKPDAAAKLEEELTETNLSVELVETKYPQGVENMLIYALTDRKVAATQLPLEAGVVVNNVSTAAAISRAVFEGKPLIERTVTVTGPAIKGTGNFRIPIGTSFEEILNHCGLRESARLILAGGPMMGVPQADLSVPTVKATGGITAFTGEKELLRSEHPCIRCGRCVRHCPQQLVPTELFKLIENKNYEKAKELNVQGCLECGACSYICPSNIPLVHWLRIGKENVC